MALAMTHEEVVTWLAAREIHSLPAAAAALVPLPDQGARRGAAQERHPAHARVHHEGLLQPRRRRGGPAGAATRSTSAPTTASSRAAASTSMMVEGDSGMMGGDVSHEYMAFSEAGEDEIVFCRALRLRGQRRDGVGRAGARGAGERPRRDRRGPRRRFRPDRRPRAPHARHAHHRAGRRLPRPAGRGVRQGARRGRRGRQGRRSWSCCAAITSSASSSCEGASGGEFRLATPRRSRSGPGRRARVRRARPDARCPCSPTRPAPRPLRRPAPTRRTTTCAGVEPGAAARRPTSPTCGGRAPATRARAARARSRARAPSRSATSSSSAPSTRQPMGATFLDEAGEGAADRHGQLRDRPGAHRGRRRRAAPRRRRHRLAGLDRAVRRAPGPRARRRRDAGGASPSRLYAELGGRRPRGALRRSRAVAGREVQGRRPARLPGCRSSWGSGPARAIVEVKTRATGERRDVAVGDLAAARPRELLSR